MDKTQEEQRVWLIEKLKAENHIYKKIPVPVDEQGQKDLLLPAISQCILDVQPEEGFITVHIMEGLEDL